MAAGFRTDQGIRTLNRVGIDGSLLDQTAFRALKWAAVIRAAHSSVQRSASSPPQQQIFVFLDSANVGEEQPSGERVFREFRQSLRNRERENLEPIAIGRKPEKGVEAWTPNCGEASAPGRPEQTGVLRAAVRGFAEDGLQGILQCTLEHPQQE